MYVTRAGSIYQTLAINAWGRTIAAGASETYNMTGTTAASNRNDLMCAIAMVVPHTDSLPSPISVTSGLGLYDTNPTDNEACVTWAVTGVGIGESLDAIANKTFVIDNQLVIENDVADFNNEAIINVISMSGQVVASKNMVITRGRNIVELNSLSTGIYLVSIQMENEITTTKVMVK